jgi:hypothetical protein
MDDSKQQPILDQLTQLNMRIDDLEGQPITDPRVDGIESRLAAVEEQLAGLVNNPAWKELIQELRVLQQQVVDLKATVDNLQGDTAPDGQVDDLQVIYLTSINNPRCKRTDEKVAQMREDGYDYIRTVVLATHEASVSDVPRLVIFPGKEVVRGESDVLVYLSQLVR